MQDNIPDALIGAFERQYGVNFDHPDLRNERLAMRYGWTAAMEQANTEVHAAWIAGQDEARSQRPVQCLHQIQEPTVSQQLTIAQAAPGWKLVPVDATRAMTKAAQKADAYHAPHEEWLHHEWPDQKRIWDAMLAAAPTPPAQERKPLGPDGVQKLIFKLNAEHGDNWNSGDLVRAAEIHHGIGATNAD